MTKITAVFATTLSIVLLSACQTAPSPTEPQHRQSVCAAIMRLNGTAICLDNAWVQDVFIDGFGDTTKVMVVLNNNGIKALQNRITPTTARPVALQIGAQFFESFDSSAITSGFLVLKPFNSREEAHQVVNMLKP